MTRYFASQPIAPVQIHHPKRSG